MEQGRCPNCGAILPPDVSDEQCPSCVMQLALTTAEHLDDASSGEQETLGLEAAIDGPYTIVRRLGEGGMGVVYLAEQTRPIRRLVAIKIARAVLGSRQEIARFESERQALAVLQHPGIATIFDAGTTRDGRPFFTLEYVPGVPITAYCDDQQLSIAARLELFQQVCTAVQHAHQKGIVHRDLKPSNVLVMPQDGGAVAKVIDFGLAKAVNANFSEHTWVTQQGVFIGTPAYMSPEQAGAPRGSIDTRTDIYSLGVILYELLAGVRPFEPKHLQDAAAAEMLRIVREVEPTPLSTRLRALNGATASEIARCRQFDVRSLSRKLRGELEWITLRCLEKDPARRYASASELSADIFQYLHQEPVSAGPPRLSYRLSKLVRKYRAAFAGIAAAVFALAIGFAVSLALYRRANELMALSVRQSYVANIAAADLAIQLGSAQEAQRRLARADQSLRSWEWNHLSLVADSSVWRFETTPAPVVSINLDPSSRRIVWSGGDRVTTVDLASKHSVSRRVSGFLFDRSNDGRRALVWTLASSGRGALELRNLESDEPIATIGDQFPRYGLFSPDGTRVLVILDEQDWAGVTWRFLILDTRTGARLTHIDMPLEVEMPYSHLRGIAFSPDGRRLAFCTGSNLYMWDTSTARALVKTPTPDLGRLGLLAYAASGTKIVCIGQSGRYMEWEATTGRAITSRSLPSHGSPAAMTSDGSRIAWIAGERVVIADAVTGTSLMNLLGHRTPVMSVAYSADDSLLISGALNGIRVWRAEFDRAVTRLSRVEAFESQPGMNPAAALVRASTVTSLAFHPTRPILIAADGTHGVGYWDLDSSRQVALQSAHRSEFLSARLSRDGRTVISVDWRGTIHRADFGAFQPSLTIDSDHTSEPTLTAQAIDVDDLSVFTARQGRQIEVWSTVTGRLIARVGDGSDVVSCLAASPQFLVAGTVTGHLLVWRRPSWKLLHRVQSHDRDVWAVSISNDGRRIASGGRDTIVRIFDSNDWERSISLVGHQGPIRALAFHPDGGRLVSGADDGTVRVWDAVHEDLLLTLRHDSPITSLAFSPDQSRVAASSATGLILVWNTASRDIGLGNQQPSK
jgi:eukaryotic-like serine/threonine-protein kinase